MSKNLLVNFENKPCYEIHIRDNFDDLKLDIQSLEKKYNRVCIVSETNVAPLYLDSVKKAISDLFSVTIDFVFAAGEESKNIATVNQLYEKLIVNHFDRGDLLIALGGGVVGDLTGFCAATYLRGIDFIQVPTTLLSQVDSSIGGKTGVDYLKYKNMIGAFYMPKLVYMNLSTLSTLDNRQFISGFGEIIKHSLIADKNYFEFLKSHVNENLNRDIDILESTIYESCKIKKYAVENDPKEHGIRTYLNFGHTIGHAVEKLCDFSLYHGECVAIGMVAASYLSMKVGNITDGEFKAIKEMIQEYHLPVSASGLNSAEILSATKSDKKRFGNQIKFVLLEHLGQAQVNMNLTDDVLVEAINLILD